MISTKALLALFLCSAFQIVAETKSRTSSHISHSSHSSHIQFSQFSQNRQNQLARANPANGKGTPKATSANKPTATKPDNETEQDIKVANVFHENLSAGAVPIYLIMAGFLGIMFAGVNYFLVSKVSVEIKPEESGLLEQVHPEANVRIIEIYEAIRAGARSFLDAEYKLCGAFIAVFGILVFVLCSYIDKKWNWVAGGLTVVSFLVGAATSMLCGYIGMMVAVFSNARTCVAATGKNPWRDAFNTAFRGGAVMGYTLCSLALLMLYALSLSLSHYYDVSDANQAKLLFQRVAGFGLGAAGVALFGRVGGGIYTKAADVGADLAGKVVHNIPEDDPRNPATIADNVGDNVGDVAGMGADLFGSFASSTCSAFVILSASLTDTKGNELEWRALMYPLMISATGIYVCGLCSFLATHVMPAKNAKDVENVLKVQIFITSVVLSGVLYPITAFCLPANFDVLRANDNSPIDGTVLTAYACVMCGLWAGCAIGFVTEYFTSHSYAPTREVAQACETGAATNIIYGLALGFKSAVIPVSIIAFVVLIAFFLLDMLGVALAALGMLSTLSTCLSIDVYGPICDNAGGIAEMAELPEAVREITDELDAAGNTTAAIGKGFAIGSACLVGLALFGAFIKRCSQHHKLDSSLLDPVVFAFLLLGAMIPYFFTAMTMKSVGVAAMAMVKEVEHQFKTKKGLLEGTPGHEAPDHARCIKISTDASLREMILPGLLIMSTPVLTGTLFGCKAIVGLLSGAISSSIQMAISQSNTGGAWDNAKKYVEKGGVFIKNEDGELIKQGKGSDIHKAAVVGDTVGDPLKDTSGPALNIVMKLMAILSLVLSDFFLSIQDGHGLIGVYLLRKTIQ